MKPDQMRLYRLDVAVWQRACKPLGRRCDEEALRALHASCGTSAGSKDFYQCRPIEDAGKTT